MNQKLLNDLWEKATPNDVNINVDEPTEDLHIVHREQYGNAVDCMILHILIEGNPEWHYCRHSPDGIWKSMSDCGQCSTENI